MTKIKFSALKSREFYNFEQNRSLLFASGVTALAAVFTTCLNSGDHAIVSEVCYSATNLRFREYLPKKYGVEVTLLDTNGVSTW